MSFWDKVKKVGAEVGKIGKEIATDAYNDIKNTPERIKQHEQEMESKSEYQLVKIYFQDIKGSPLRAGAALRELKKRENGLRCSDGREEVNVQELIDREIRNMDTHKLVSLVCQTLAATMIKDLTVEELEKRGVTRSEYRNYISG